MSTIASTLTPLIESHVFNVCQSSSQKSKYPSYAIDLKVLLSDLCYVFFNNNKGAAIDRTYVVKFLQKNHHDYTHNTYIIISFLMQLIECEKNMLGVNHKHCSPEKITKNSSPPKRIHTSSWRIDSSIAVENSLMILLPKLWP